MADGSVPTWETLCARVPRVARGGTWSTFYLRVALADTDLRLNAKGKNPIETVAGSPSDRAFPAYSAMPSLLMTLLWLTRLCANASGQPPGELVRSFGADV
jgi:hypothetical protein